MGKVPRADLQNKKVQHNKDMFGLAFGTCENIYKGGFTIHSVAYADDVIRVSVEKFIKKKKS